ncbi:MAG: phosphatase PAP2 family protein [Acidimicrobiales bacterium]
MWLPWDLALYGAAALFAFGVVATRATSPRQRFAASFAREAAVVLVLYAIWIIAGRLSVYDVEGANGRAELLWDWQRTLLLPNEAALQKAVLPHSWLVQANNIYYAVMHVPVMVGTLIWIWIRHREHYSGLRNVLAGTTAASLLIQLIAVAPPRFVESFGVIDTPELYGQSVYSALGYRTAGQLQAMPSIHVGWAILVGWYGWRASRSGWRWLAIAHAVATMLVVVVTGNHYWLDGIVAGAIIVIAIPLEGVVRRRFGRVSGWFGRNEQRSGENGTSLTLPRARQGVST